eukprot:gb/GEZN01003364.1/.p1 GENE.gb/GEZN01003364.1/~~gb/GEZN01003364.1/.p1  ORF type:complete len:612 (-),score=59.47 gb/GEZN01003364.1/:339-2174(-)
MGKDGEALISPLVLPRRLRPIQYVLVAHVIFWSVLHWFTMLDATEVCLQSRDCRRHLRGGQSWLFWLSPNPSTSVFPGTDPTTGQGLWTDVGDHQWRAFREAIPLIVLAMVGITVPSRLLRRLSGSSVRWQLNYYCLVGLGFIAFLHGSFAVHVLAVLFCNFWLCRLCGRRSCWGQKQQLTQHTQQSNKHTRQYWVGALVTWALGMGAIVGSEWFHSSLMFESLFGSRAAWLDQYTGQEHWWISINLLMLRMVSHNMDYFSTLQQQDRINKRVEEKDEAQWLARDLQGTPKGAAPCNECDSVADQQRDCYKVRERLNQPLEEFTFQAYLAFCLYPPLYLAGPIMSFNAWLSNVRFPPDNYTKRSLVVYIARLLVTMFVMECFTSYLSLWAILRSHTYEQFAAFQLASFCYMNLKMIWMKFLIIWRLFRLWAILDGIVPVENMNRCISNSLGTISGFWRGWHRSFNRWLIRYVYIPVGGGRRRLVGYLVTFTFVAVWHDRNLELLAWGWLLVLFFIPEYVGELVARKWQLQHSPWYRLLFTIGGGFNLSFLIIANAVGFGMNRAGVSFLSRTLFSAQGGLTCLYFVWFLFIGSNCAWDYRTEEKKQNVFHDF